MNAIAVIPARLASTRLPRKMLRQIAGQTLIARVYEGVRSSPLLDDVIVATDSEEIMEVCRQHGWNARMTSAAHRSGTERVREISHLVAADIYINVQGDEPLTRAEHIAALIAVMKDPELQVGTLKTLASREDINNPNAVKVVTDSAGRALYFSRATIPYDRDAAGPRYFKHLGSTDSARCPSRHWNAASGSNSCGFWKTGFRFRLGKLRTIRSGWIPRTICAAWKRFSGSARRSKLRLYGTIRVQSLFSSCGWRLQLRPCLCGQYAARNRGVRLKKPLYPAGGRSLGKILVGEFIHG